MRVYDHRDACVRVYCTTKILSHTHKKNLVVALPTQVVLMPSFLEKPSQCASVAPAHRSGSGSIREREIYVDTD